MYSAVQVFPSQAATVNQMLQTTVRQKKMQHVQCFCLSIRRVARKMENGGVISSIPIMIGLGQIIM